MIRRAVPRLLAAGALLGLAGCLDLSLTEVAFPPGIAGLPADQPWMRLPVGVWVTEGQIEARAIAACHDPACPGHPTVAILRARGRDAETLRAESARPERLAAALAGRPRPGAAPSVVTKAEPLRLGGLAGFALAMSRRDGTRPVHAVALLRPQGGTLDILLVIGEAPTPVRTLADAIASNLS